MQISSPLKGPENKTYVSVSTAKCAPVSLLHVTVEETPDKACGFQTTHLYGGKPMAMTVATSRSAGLSTMPSSMTRQPSFTTGKKMNSMMSCKVEDRQRHVKEQD